MINKCNLNIGCGRDIRKDCMNIDCVPLVGVDKVVDLNTYPYPFKDNTFDKIYCLEVLEHLRDIVKPIEELYRISKNGGKITITTPIFSSSNAANNPTHKSFFTIRTFDFFCGKGIDYYSKPKFKIVEKKILFHKFLFIYSFLFNLNDFMQRLHNSFFCFLCPAIGLYFKLEVIK